MITKTQNVGTCDMCYAIADLEKSNEVMSGVDAAATIELLSRSGGWIYNARTNEPKRLMLTPIMKGGFTFLGVDLVNDEPKLVAYTGLSTDILTGRVMYPEEGRLFADMDPTVYAAIQESDGATEQYLVDYIATTNFLAQLNPGVVAEVYGAIGFGRTEEEA